MKKQILTIIGALFYFFALAQSVPSPEAFLGYKVGTRYTPHHQLVAYCNAVANANPAMVKMEKYGETNERKPLYLLYISTPENIQQLESIRKQNIDMVTGENSATNNKKTALVWLSYNVHGNEPSSSEAAMLTLFELVNANNTQSKEWLKNTVVIIDPCLNPDGRDRYVNWYNSVVGASYNANPASREHIEPWPGGRSNHYNFDLNRDWAWQTQVETQQRIVKYQQWMPQVHVDFHEQGYNEPYYFAPAAEPFHEVITPWQSSFQTTIGRNNAKYFDANAWLYFTKERFDLFYPSYGDTYPTYNGSIGMTYEQGGHSRGGLAVETEDGDTLTLVDRALHHHTTGMSTIEISSKNADKLVTEFKKYFEANWAGNIGIYKTYILTAANLQSLQPLATLLNKNEITYTLTEQAIAGKGYNYFTQKEDNFKTNAFSILINNNQAKASLVQVLFEPLSKLNDSITYDITAWSLPYVYGLQSYAVKEKITATAYNKAATVGDEKENTYGYLIPYNSFNNAKAIPALLQMGYKLRVSQKPITFQGKEYGYGAILLIKTSNIAIWQKQPISVLLKELGVQDVIALNTGFMDKGPDFGSPDIVMLKAPKIAVLTGEGVSSLGAGEVWNYFEKVVNYPVSMVNASDFGRLNLKHIDLLILPDGNYKFIGDKNGNAKLKDFVKSGGKVIAIENAVAQFAEEDFGLKAKEKDEKAKEKAAEVLLKKYADRERDYVSESVSGAIYRVDLDATHPLAFGYGNTYFSLKQDANTYSFLKEGWNVGVLKKDNAVAGFVGSKLKPQLKDDLIFGVEEMGRGSIVYLADDPLFRMFWENGKLLFTNAVFIVGQ